MWRKCMRCGKVLEPGSLGYRIEIRALADFDGWIADAEGEGDALLEQAIRQAERSDPRVLEKEVYEERVLVLCRSCRDRFMEEAGQPFEGPFGLSGGGGEAFH